MLAALLKNPKIGVLGLATWKFSLGRHSTLGFAAEQQWQISHLHQKWPALVAKAAATQRGTV